jgi:hypothetical protein
VCHQRRGDDGARPVVLAAAVGWRRMGIRSRIHAPPLATPALARKHFCLFLSFFFLDRGPSILEISTGKYLQKVVCTYACILETGEDTYGTPEDQHASAYLFDFSSVRRIFRL